MNRTTKRKGQTSKEAIPPFAIEADPLPQWRDAKAQLERWMLKRALNECGGNMAAASRKLGITKVAVLHAVRRHGLSDLTHSRR